MPNSSRIEDINNYLLQHKEVIDFIKRRGGKPKFVFLMFDEETERLSKELGAEVWFPKAKLRTAMDNKIETVRIGNKAGVPSVPNTLAEVEGLRRPARRSAKRPGIGHDLVLQSAFGDSGHTTFFIKSEADFRRHEHEIVGEGEIKIMKRIDCRGSAIEACATKRGHHRRPADDRARRLQGTDALSRRLVRQRDPVDGLSAQGAQEGARPDLQVRRAAAQGRLSRLFRARFPDRQEDRRSLAGRAEPAHHRRVVDDQPRGLRPCRRAAVPVPPAGVLEEEVRARRGRAERPLGRSRHDRQLVADGHQAHRGQRRHLHRRARNRHLQDARGRPRGLRPLRLSPPRGGKRERGVLPAHPAARRLPLRGRRSRHPRDARPVDDQGLQAERPGQEVDPRHQAIASTGSPLPVAEAGPALADPAFKIM